MRFIGPAGKKDLTIFECPYCHKIVIRHSSSGKKQKSCGCMRSEFSKERFKCNKKPCSIDGCTKKQIALGYCTKHYQQIKIHGTLPERIATTPNVFTTTDNECFISLFNRQGKEVAKAVIDLEDVEKCRTRKWHFKKSGYVASTNGKGTIRLHRFILNLPVGIMTDHKDGNPLNNKKSNLRECNSLENNWNRGKSKTNHSGFKGVHLHKQGKWRSIIRVCKKVVDLGLFTNPIDAAYAYDKAAIKYHGEFARTNFQGE